MQDASGVIATALRGRGPKMYAALFTFISTIRSLRPSPPAGQEPLLSDTHFLVFSSACDLDRSRKQLGNLRGLEARR